MLNIHDGKILELSLIIFVKGKKSLDRDSYLGKAVRFLYLELGSINRSDM